METITAGIILGFLTILVLVYRYLKAPNRFWAKLNVKSIDRTSYLDSSLDGLNGSVTHERDLERLKKYGRIYGSFEFGKPMLMITEPSLVKSILVKDFNVFHNTQDVSDFVSPHDMTAKMLFVLRDERWKRVRTIISPVFTTGKIKKTFPQIYDCVKTLLRNFTKAKTDVNVDVKKFYEAFAMDLIANVAFATKIDSHNDPQNPFVINARRIFEGGFNWRVIISIFLPRLARILGVTTSDPVPSNFFQSVITEIMNDRKRRTEKKNYFIQMMMDSSIDSTTDSVSTADANKKLTPEELMSNTVMFFFVAFGTTSLTLSYMSYLLALHPEVQEKLIKEIDDALKDNELEVTYEAIQNMKYMDMVVSETLRLYPIAIRTDREASTDYVLESTGIKLPKGTVVTIPIYAMQRDPEIFPNPEKFDPNRFTPEEKAKRDPYSYIPFSAGPRNCVGMRFALFDIKVCLAYVLSQFRFKRSPKTHVPLKIVTGAPAPLLQPGEIVISVEERKDKVLKNFY